MVIKTKKRSLFLLMLPLLFIFSLIGVLLARNKTAHAPQNYAQATSNKNSPSKIGTTTTKAPSTRPVTFNKQLFSHDDPTSIWVVVNKHRPLNPATYAPALAVPDMPLRLGKDAGEMHVAAQMAPALEALSLAAVAAKVPLMLASGYRSYDTQVAVYANEVKANGQAGADRESARPGYSEHQTGWAADLEPVSRQCEVTDCFGDLPEGKWLAANAATFGFIIRYTLNNEPTTGYKYEPWHVRYVGIPLATELQTEHTDTLETFFGLGAAPNYQ